MGLLRRIRDLFTFPMLDPDETDPTYRCIRCGESFERDVRTCSSCGGPFVVPPKDE